MDGLDDRLATALGQMTPRRYRLLVACINLPPGFTGADVRQVVAGTGLESSLLRDLRGLEVGGWLSAEPPHVQARQGRTVRYKVTEMAGTAFSELADGITRALSQPGPAASGT